MSEQSEHSFLASEIGQCAPEKAFFHVVPVPLEVSVSYGGGTAKGPEAILRASDQLELWDGYSIPAQKGIHTLAPINCAGTVETVLHRISSAVDTILRYEAIPVLLGGEHTITYGALVAMKRKYGKIGVIQFDAHADLRDSYDGTKWSHASVMCRAVKDLELPLVQFGVRALCLEEVEARRKHHIWFHDGAQLSRVGLPDQLLPDFFPEQVYITFDVDGLDVSIMPATGTPVPGGLGWYQALEIVERVLIGRKACGFDVVELAPIPGLHAADFTAAQLVYSLMGLVERNRTSSSRTRCW